jgi:hypothetical protein
MMTATEKASLEATAENLRASIAAREAIASDNPDYAAVTDHERLRLASVEAALQSAPSISTKPKP